jgi:hypothetical protein
VPVRPTVCGEAAALSVTETFAVRVPAAVGSNVTVILQVPATAMGDVQLLVSVKSEGSVPVIAMVVKVSGAVPGFDRVTVCVASATPTSVEANVSEVGENEISGTPVPVPDNVADCVEPVVLPALSVTVTLALRLPAAFGVNVTVIVQFVPAATEVPQVLFSENELASVPEIAMPAIFSTSVPPLVRVMACVGAAVPTGSLVNVRLVGFRVACGMPRLRPVTENV